jgi:hypothetical protein
MSSESSLRSLGLTTVLALLTCRAVSAVTLYVAPDGDDRWSGTLQQANADKSDGPLKTLSGARDAIRKLKARGGAREPVTVLLADGTYCLTETFVLEPQDSGTADCPITYAAQAGAKPIVSGGRTISGWKQQEAGLWTAEVPDARDRKWPFRQLWVHGRRAILARSPNDGFYRIVGAAGPTVDPATGRERDASKSAFRFTGGDIRNWSDLRDANATVFFHWETGMLRFKSIDQQTNTVTFTGEFKWPFWGRQRYYVENVFEALDAPGEWYLNGVEGRLYYRPRPATLYCIFPWRIRGFLHCWHLDC